MQAPVHVVRESRMGKSAPKPGLESGSDPDVLNFVRCMNLADRQLCFESMRRVELQNEPVPKNGRTAPRIRCDRCSTGQSEIDKLRGYEVTRQT